MYMGYTQKMRRKWGIFSNRQKWYNISRDLFGNIFVLLKSKRIDKSGRAFKFKYNHLINQLWQILPLLDALIDANKWDISNRTKNNCLSQDTNLFSK